MQITRRKQHPRKTIVFMLSNGLVPLHHDKVKIETIFWDDKDKTFWLYHPENGEVAMTIGSARNWLRQRGITRNLPAHIRHLLQVPK